MLGHVYGWLSPDLRLTAIRGGRRDLLGGLDSSRIGVIGNMGDRQSEPKWICPTIDRQFFMDMCCAGYRATGIWPPCSSDGGRCTKCEELDKVEKKEESKEG